MDEGGGAGRVACAARLCHGRSGRDRHEPVLEPSPVPSDTSVAADTEWDEAMSQVQQANHPAVTS